ncbi:MAG TPA: poly-gamma-glutamate hydrolase family protein [Pyrinomonadaceae bacterium]|nr:poly-gamma-glutamate hydrolase family protein [Pyrinomonadaceae bacterium]
MKTESDDGRLSLRTRLLFAAAFVCACALLAAAALADDDYYNCYQPGGTCAPPLLSNDNNCLRGADKDYEITSSNAGSRVTVLSFHGGGIELYTSKISSDLAARYGWNRYDFNAHARAQCLAVGNFNSNKKLHITATNFNEQQAVGLVGMYPKAVAIHGHARSYPRGTICVGGLDAAARAAFRSYVQSHAALWNTSTNPNAYPLDPVDAVTAPDGSNCGDDALRGRAATNLVNRTSSHAGLQLEMHKDFRADLANPASNFNTLRDIVYEAVNQALAEQPGQGGCVTVDSAGTPWQNRALDAEHAGTFTAEVDATPLANNIDAGVGLSNGPQTDFPGLACIARFNAQGNIDARNGGSYAAASPIAYAANATYHLRFVVNVPAHTYSVYVTPSPGGAEQAVGLNYAFRTEQSSAGVLNNWSLFGDAGPMRACWLGSSCRTAAPADGWLNNPFAAQGGGFTAELDATPLAPGVDAVVGLSNGEPTLFSGFACLVRFNPAAGTIEARDGGVYRAASAITYAANTTYHFRLAVNVPAHTYSVYVTPAGGIEQTVGLGYAFRTEQQSVAALNNYGLTVDGGTGSVRVCNFRLATDRFGVKMLYSTMPGGIEWYAKWDGNARSFTSADPADPSDPWFDPHHGTASYHTTGDGVLRISGSAPRMYVHDPAKAAQFRDVEITMYFMRVGDDSVEWAGMVSVARSNHGTTGSELANPCDTRGVGARMRYDGKVDFDKETKHPDAYAAVTKNVWPGGLPANVWIGYKHVVYDLPNGNVREELWIDESGGAGGGDWRRLNEFVDDGANFGVNGTPCKSGIDPRLRLANSPTRAGSESGKPNVTVYFRSDDVHADGLLYKWGSVREIAVAP